MTRSGGEIQLFLSPIGQPFEILAKKEFLPVGSLRSPPHPTPFVCPLLPCPHPTPPQNELMGELINYSTLELNNCWAPNGGSQGSPPMGSLWLPRVPLPGWSRTPPMGSLGLPRVPLPWVPSHGIPLGSQGSPS